MKTVVRAIAAWSVCLAACGSLAGERVEFVPVPLLPGALVGEPVSLSADGTTVTGLARMSSAGAGHAFRFVRGVGITPVCPAPSKGKALSADGRFVVGDFGTEGFTSLDAGPGVVYGSRFTTIADVTANGLVIVGNTTVNNLGPFLGDPHGAITPLNGLANHDDTEIVAIAGDGSAIVATAQRVLNDAPSFQAAKRTASGGWLGLGFLETGFSGDNGNPESYAQGVSPTGAVVVGFSKVRDGFGGFTYRAFAHRDDRGMVDLGSLTGGAALSLANDVAENGLVVGSSDGGSSTEGSSAVIWLPGETTPRDLKQYAASISPAVATEFSGWSFTSAVAVSANGSWVLGRGLNPQGQSQGFLLRMALDGPTTGPCRVDFNADDFLNQEDLLGFITAYLDESIPFGPSGTGRAPCPDAPAPYGIMGYAADFDRDCTLSEEDLMGFITAYLVEAEAPQHCTPG